MKPSRDFCPQTVLAASVTSFTHLSTACVWQGNFGRLTFGVTSIVMSYLNSASVIALVTGGSEIWQTAQLIMSKYYTVAKFSFSGTLNLHICPLRFAALAFVTHQVSWLDEHLLNVPSSIFAWQLGIVVKSRYLNPKHKKIVDPYFTNGPNAAASRSTHLNPALQDVTPDLSWACTAVSVFRLQNFRVKDPQNQCRNFYAPMGHIMQRSLVQFPQQTLKI